MTREQAKAMEKGDSKRLFEEADIYCRHLFYTEQEQAFEIVSRLKDFALKLEARNKELDHKLRQYKRLEDKLFEIGASQDITTGENIMRWIDEFSAGYFEDGNQ